MRVLAVALTIAFQATGTIANSPPPKPTSRLILFDVEPSRFASHLSSTTVRSLSTGRSISVEARGRQLSLPIDFLCPGSIEAPGFESVTYTGTTPSLMIFRALGRLRGHVSLPTARTLGEGPYVWILQRTGETRATEVQFEPDHDDAFDIELPSGIYNGAVSTSRSLSRIRSAILISPGANTDVGTVACEPGKAVMLRLTEARSRRPVPGVRVIWDRPREALNGAAARAIFGLRWSGISSRDGTLTIPLIGPMPLPVRWRVEAPGFSVTTTPTRQLRSDDRYPLPAIELQPLGEIEVRVSKRRDLSLSQLNAVLYARETEQDAHYRRIASVEVRQGVAILRAVNAGSVRVALEQPPKRRIAYKDLKIFSAHATVLFDVEPKIIHGTVTAKGEPVEGARVVLADPHDATMVLAQAQSGLNGAYNLSTFQTGEIFIYAVTKGGPGTTSGSVSHKLDITGSNDYQVEFQMPDAGAMIIIVDAASGTPVPHAVIDRRTRLVDRQIQGVSETDEQGRLLMSGFQEGVATLCIRAKGYRTKTLDISINESTAETRVGLQRSGGVSGKVIGPHGEPVVNARISGGFANEFAMQPFFEATSDALGYFRFEFAPEPGTTFYTVAAGYALAISEFHPGDDNDVVVGVPTLTHVYLLEKSITPTRRYRVVAAPSDGSILPLGVLQDIAEVNGMEESQLLGNAADGSVVLPELLPPGSYDFFVTQRGGVPFSYKRIGRARIADRSVEYLDVLKNE